MCKNLYNLCNDLGKTIHGFQTGLLTMWLGLLTLNFRSPKGSLKFFLGSSLVLNDPYCKKIKRIRIKYEHIRIVTHNLLLHMENQESKMRSKRLTICQIRIVDYRTYVCLAIQWRHEFELRDGLQYSVFSCRLPNATKFSI